MVRYLCEGASRTHYVVPSPDARRRGSDSTTVPPVNARPTYWDTPLGDATSGGAGESTEPQAQGSPAPQSFRVALQCGRCGNLMSPWKKLDRGDFKAYYCHRDRHVMFLCVDLELEDDPGPDVHDLPATAA